MVVVIESRVLQAFCLAFAQHAERGAGFQPQGFHLAHHFLDLIEVAVFRLTPCGAHAKTRRAMRLGLARGVEHGIERQHFLGGNAGVVARCLRAVAAIFRTAAGLDRQQRGKFHFLRIEILAMHLLRAVQQVVERQVEQRSDRINRPRGRRRGGYLAGIDRRMKRNRMRRHKQHSSISK